MRRLVGNSSNSIASEFESGRDNTIRNPGAEKEVILLLIKEM
jgi:hypothetical protein